MNKIYIYLLLFICFSFLEAKDSFSTKSGNVVEGIAHFNKSWIVSQTHSNKSITFSIFNSDLNLRQSINVKYPSHAQDLSILKIKDKVYLFTTGKHWSGVAMFELKENNNTFSIKFKKKLKLGIGKNTPTISEDGKYIATIANNSVYIFDFRILNPQHSSASLFSFVLNKVQREKKQWKQGIAMKNNNIYILSGNNSIGTPKYLIIYDAYGKVLKKIKLKLDINIAKKEGNKLEVEGLTFKNNELYTTVMTGHNGKNKKRLLKIYEENSR